ncbi:MAG: Lrp/AsnC family transcriptional regulator [Thermoplasmatota archaeon]
MQRNIDAEDEFEFLKSVLSDDWDDMDIKIYQILRDNGRMTDTELAEELDTSITTARRRRKQLQDKGYLMVLALLVIQKAKAVYTDVLVKISSDASIDELDEFIKDAVENVRIYEVTQYLNKKAMLLRFLEKDLENINRHITRFMLERDVVEDYEILPASISPKAWNRVLQNDHPYIRDEDE